MFGMKRFVTYCVSVVYRNEGMPEMIGSQENRAPVSDEEMEHAEKVDRIAQDISTKFPQGYIVNLSVRTSGDDEHDGDSEAHSFVPGRGGVGSR